MSDERSIFELVKRYPEATANAETWAEFCQLSGQTWADSIVWAERILLTVKHNPHGSTRGLFFPKARTFADIFEAACFLPSYTREPSREHGAPVLQEPGFYYIVGRGMRGYPETTYDANIGVGRYVRTFSDGTVCRGEKGNGKRHHTRVKPKPGIVEAVEPAMISPLGTFEAITWHSGAILITARDDHGIGTRWLAVLDPGSTVDEILPQDQLAMIQKHKAEEAADWSCIFKGEDGREYLDRDKCNIEIRTR